MNGLHKFIYIVIYINYNNIPEQLENLQHNQFKMIKILLRESYIVFVSKGIKTIYLFQK
jgi:uncharacterized protein YlbG (UPF0298 family)